MQLKAVTCFCLEVDNVKSASSNNAVQGQQVADASQQNGNNVQL